jgi:hypothetical protein
MCNCAQPAGSFRKDVADHASISSEDIEISSDLPVPDDDGLVVCPICKATVAQRFSDGWRVRTRNGWLG